MSIRSNTDYNPNQTPYIIPAQQNQEAAEPMDVDAGNVPAPQAQAHTVPAHPQVQIINQQAVQVLQPQLTHPAVQIQTVQPQFNIVPLALHLVAFGNNTTNKNTDAEGPKTTVEKLTTQFFGKQITLQRLCLTLEILRKLEISTPQVPTTTGAVNATTSSHAVSSDRSADFKVDLDQIKELLKLEFKGKPEALAKQVAFLESMFSFNSDLVTKAIASVEQLQINILKECDEVADKTDYYDPCPTQIAPPSKNQMTRCLTWIVKLRENGDEYVIPPYFTETANHKMHCMNYLIHRADNAARKILKVVVGNFLVEIPFEVQIPQNQKFMDVVVFAIPNITLKDPNLPKPYIEDNLNIEGVKLILYALERRV